jgi:hypothetical protein
VVGSSILIAALHLVTEKLGYKGIRKYWLDLDGSLEAASLHLIVSEAFFNNWADFLFVEKSRNEVTGK